MPVFEYIGFDQNGLDKKGVITSDNEIKAREQLRSGGILVSSVKVTRSSGKGRASFSFKNIFKGRAQLEVVNLTRQLATLLKSGIPLAQSLDVLIQQINNVTLERVFRQILDQIVQGDGLADAMANHPEYFSELYVSMIKAGELSGKLDDVLDRLAIYTYKKKMIEEKVKATLAYPFFICLIGVIAVSVLLFGIMPRIAGFLKDAKIPLPLPTKFFLGISEFFLSIYGVLFFIVIFVCFYFFRKYIQTPKGELWFDRFKIRMPLFGELIKKSAVSKFAITFSTLLRTGIPALEGLKVVGNVVGNSLMKNVIKDVHDAVIEGSDMSTVLKDSEVFPPVVGFMMSIGEQSGQLEEMLERIAEAYDQEIEIASNKLISVIEPIMIVILAVIVGSIIVSVLLPILNMSNVKLK